MGLEERYEALKTKAIEVKSSIEHSKRVALDLKYQYTNRSNDYKDNKKSLKIQDSAIQIMKEIVDEMSSEHIEKVKALVSYGLQTVFFDKDYVMEIAMGDKRNAKTAEFYLVERMEDKVLRTEFEDAIGGGIMVVVGFIMQVFYIEMLGLSRFMLLDESFTQLSDIYIPYLKEFLNQLADQKGFIFVLISHDERLVINSKKIYQMEDGEAKQIDEVRARKVVAGSVGGDNS